MSDKTPKVTKNYSTIAKKCPNVQNCQRRCDFVVSVLLFAHTERVGKVSRHSIFRGRLQYPLEPALVYLDASFMPSDCGQAGQSKEIGKALNNSDIYLPLNTSTLFNRKKSRNTVYWGFYPPICMHFFCPNSVYNLQYPPIGGEFILSPPSATQTKRAGNY